MHHLARYPLIVLPVLLLLVADRLRATDSDDPVAVFAATFNGYARTRLPDKSFKPEAYVFGEGGCWSRPVKDTTMEEMTFLRVARAVAAPLGRQNYRPARTSAEAELLILVFWGSTEGTGGDTNTNETINQYPGEIANAIAIRTAVEEEVKAELKAQNPSVTAEEIALAVQRHPKVLDVERQRDSALWQIDMANRERDRLDDRNARILGYTEVLDRANFSTHMSFSQDILAEVGHNRYYVVLQAYDFRTAVKVKKLKPLWTARISIDESGHGFDQSLDKMLRSAARYLGQDSGGLRRNLTRDTRVELGPMEVIETVPPGDPEAPQPKP